MGDNVSFIGYNRNLVQPSIAHSYQKIKIIQASFEKLFAWAIVPYR